MTAPAVSVILPTRNRAQLVGRAVRSALAQTFTDFELLVVNDASIDDTERVLASFADPRLRVIKRDKNSGAAAARNAGIEQARGKYVAFLDDDDFWMLEKLQVQVEAMERAPADVVLCLAGFVCVLADYSTYIGGEQVLHNMNYRQGGGQGGPSYWLISTPSWLVKRETLEQVGHFDDRFRSYDDWELGLRLWKAGRFIQIDRPLWIQDWRIGHSSMVFNRLRQADDLVLATEKHGSLWCRRVHARHFYFIGKNYCVHTSASEGIPWLVRSLKQWPFRLRCWVVLGIALFGGKALANLTRHWRELRSGLRRAITFWRRSTDAAKGTSL